jgi:hypothetical protein
LVEGVAVTSWRRVTSLVRTLMTRWGSEGGDAVLYGLAALFAQGTALLAGLPGYRVWGWIACGPYAAAAVVSVLVARFRRRRRAAVEGRSQWGPARVWLLLVVLLGATLAPLSVEVTLSHNRPTASSYVQPEVAVIAQAGHRLANGQDVYRATTGHGTVVKPTVPGEPTFYAFFPYLPLMAVFGLPTNPHGPVRVTDTRVLFSIVTLIVVGAALLLLRAPRDHKVRALQFLTVLPTAALPLATGGDDMPVVAFLLLAMVLAQRRRPGWSGLVLGVVSAMKFTAWPLAALALFCARDSRGRRAPVRMLLGMLVVIGPVVVPFALSNARAFVDNVVLYPFGISGVTSPAASNLPGHVLVTELPWLHTFLPLAVALVGGVLLVTHLVRRPPGSVSQVVTLAGWVMLVAIIFASATRVGYLLYPADFFIWGWMFAAADRSPLGTAVVTDEGGAGKYAASVQPDAREVQRDSPPGAKPDQAGISLSPAPGRGPG